MYTTKQAEEDFLHRAFTAVGVSSGDAALVARSITLSNLRGVDTHGLLRVPAYVKRLKAGLTNPRGAPRIVQEGGAYARMDADNALGQVAGHRGMEVALDKARRSGVAMVVMGNSNHFGAAAEYSLLAAGRGFIGIATSNVTPLMPPTGGRGKVLGNNPLSIAIPRPGHAPIVTDMAMTTVAMGKVALANQNGQPIPLGWAADKTGQGTTDPRAVIDGGSLLPMGGPKGYGLSLMLEVLTGVLAGAQVCGEVSSLSRMDRRLCISHMFLAVQPSFFLDPDAFADGLDRMAAQILGCELAEGSTEILLPGQLEERCMERRLRDGIPVGDAMLSELDALSGELCIPTLERWP